MRMMSKGEPFMDVPADSLPEEARVEVGERCDYCGGSKSRGEMAQSDHRPGSRGRVYAKCKRREAIVPLLFDGEVPTFSESFLYPTVGKGDARFILGVAEEYDHVIQALGPRAIRRILAVRPRLAQRLKVGEQVTEWLEDAMDPEFLRREEEFPPEVKLDHEAASTTWSILHNEYRRHYNPEESMDRKALRAYNTLTDALGRWHQDQRQKERDSLPEKLEKQARVRERNAQEKVQRRSKTELIAGVLREHAGRDPESLSRDVERALRDAA